MASSVLSATATAAHGRAPGSGQRWASSEKPFSLGAAIRAAKSGDLVVVSVLADGPTGLAGVRKGDVLVAIDGEHVSSLDDVARCLADRAAQTVISVTIRRATGEAIFRLHRSSSGEKKSTADVADALRKIAAASSQGEQQRVADTAPHVLPQKSAVAAPPARKVLQDVTNTRKQAPHETKLRHDNRNWAVSVAGDTDSPNQILLRPKHEAPPQPSMPPNGSPAKKATLQRAPSTPPAKSPAARVRFSTSETALISNSVPLVAAHQHDAAEHGAALVVAPPSPLPPRQGGTLPYLTPAFEPCPTGSPLPDLSPSSAILRSLSYSPSIASRSGMGAEGLSFEIQQMHSLLFKSSEAISSLKDELMSMKDSKIEVRAKYMQVQAAHKSMLEQQGLYKDLLTAAAKQNKRLQTEVEALRDEKNLLRMALAEREGAMAATMRAAQPQADPRAEANWHAGIDGNAQHVKTQPDKLAHGADSDSVQPATEATATSEAGMQTTACVLSAERREESTRACVGSPLKQDSKGEQTGQQRIEATSSQASRSAEHGAAAMKQEGKGGTCSEEALAECKLEASDGEIGVMLESNATESKSGTHSQQDPPHPQPSATSDAQNLVLEDLSGKVATLMTQLDQLTRAIGDKEAKMEADVEAVRSDDKDRHARKSEREARRLRTVLEANASASQKREEAMEKLKHENALLQQQVQRLSLGVHAEDVRGEATSCRGQEVAESRVVSHAHDQTQPGKSGVGVMGLGGGETEAKAKAWSQAELLSEVSRLGTMVCELQGQLAAERERHGAAHASSAQYPDIASRSPSDTPTLFVSHETNNALHETSDGQDASLRTIAPTPQHEQLAAMEAKAGKLSAIAEAAVAAAARRDEALQMQVARTMALEQRCARLEYERRMWQADGGWVRGSGYDNDDDDDSAASMCTPRDGATPRGGSCGYALPAGCMEADKMTDFSRRSRRPPIPPANPDGCSTVENNMCGRAGHEALGAGSQIDEGEVLADTAQDDVWSARRVETFAEEGGATRSSARPEPLEGVALCHKQAIVRKEDCMPESGVPPTDPVWYV